MHLHHSVRFCFEENKRSVWLLAVRYTISTIDSAVYVLGSPTGDVQQVYDSVHLKATAKCDDPFALLVLCCIGTTSSVKHGFRTRISQQTPYAGCRAICQRAIKSDTFGEHCFRSFHSCFLDTDDCGVFLESYPWHFSFGLEGLFHRNSSSFSLVHLGS